MAWVRAASLSDVWAGEMAGVIVEGVRVLLVRLDDGVYAFEDRCAHQAVPLSEGRLDGDVLECRAHHWTYEARSGRGLNPRGVRLRAFPARVEGEAILVDVSAEAVRR